MTFEGVRAWIGDGIQGTSMIDQDADVIESEFAEACVAIACEQVLATFPYGLVYVHTRTIVTEEWLRHERCRLAISVSCIQHHVFQNLRPVGAARQCIELRTDFALASGCHLMMVYFNRNTHLFQRDAHGRADILERIDGRDWEVAPLDARAVADVTAFEMFARCPCTFFRIDLDRASLHGVSPLDGVKDEEFGFWSKIGGVAQAGGFQIGLGALRQTARAAV